MSSGDGVRWARWFFADRATRPLSPSGRVTAAEAARTERTRVLFHEPPVSERIPARDPLTPADCIDLSAHYNAALSDDWHNPPSNATGWNLARLGHGRQVLGGVEFDVRGVIQLHSEGVARYKIRFPRAIDGIEVGRPCRALHFLHASIWARALPAGTKIGSYVVHYTDGQSAEIPIVHGEDALEWQIIDDDVDQLPRATVAWRGETLHHVPIRLFNCTWQNPRPEAPVASLDFLSAGTPAGPFLVALTAE